MTPEQIRALKITVSYVGWPIAPSASTTAEINAALESYAQSLEAAPIAAGTLREQVRAVLTPERLEVALQAIARDTDYFHRGYRPVIAVKLSRFLLDELDIAHLAASAREQEPNETGSWHSARRAAADRGEIPE
jgi:hypothetical protein